MYCSNFKIREDTSGAPADIAPVGGVFTGASLLMASVVASYAGGGAAMLTVLAVGKIAALPDRAGQGA